MAMRKLFEYLHCVVMDVFYLWEFGMEEVPKWVVLDAKITLSSPSHYGISCGVGDISKTHRLDVLLSLDM